MSTSDVALFNEVNQQLSKISGPVAAMAPTPDLPHPANVLSNMGLLLKALAEFYGRSNRASYLPVQITSFVSIHVAAIHAFLTTVPDGADDPVPTLAPESLAPIMMKMDQLYAHCLQYGLITFGFDAKIAQQQITVLRTFVAEIETVKADTEQKIAALSRDLELQIETASGTTAESLAKYDEALKQRIESIQPHVTAIESSATEAGKAVSTAEGELVALQKLAEDGKSIHNAVSDLRQKTSDESTTLIAEAAASLANSQSAEKQIGELSATARVQAQLVLDSRVAIKEQLDAVSGFYGEIERYKKQMLDMQNEANATVAAVEQKTTENVANYSVRTTELMEKNEHLVGQIQDHLRKAIGISLFTAFDKRRGHLFAAAVVWGALLLTGTVGAAAFAIWFVHALVSTSLDISVILARFIIAAPIAFWIAFTAKQYGRERRAEEEYAFKAAISVSLEPYRELVDRIHKDGQDPEFVKRLITDIFDNPTGRLYPPNTIDDAQDAKR